MQRAGLRPGVGDLDRHQQVIRAGLGVVHLGDPVPVAAERAGVQQLILRLVPAAAGVDIDQVLIGERALRVVVTPPVPRVAGHRVQVPPVLLDVLAVVALRAGQPERPLLQDRIPPVPQRQGKAQPLLDIAEPGQAILPPPVRPGPRLIVRQVIPRVAVGAVILPDRAPLPLAHIRPPPVPVGTRRRAAHPPAARTQQPDPAPRPSPLLSCHSESSLPFGGCHQPTAAGSPWHGTTNSAGVGKAVSLAPCRRTWPHADRLTNQPPTSPESPEPLLRPLPPPRSISRPPPASSHRDETATNGHNGHW